MIRTAWGFCSESTIANCFRHAGFLVADETSGACVIEMESEVQLSATREYTLTFNRAAAALGGDVCTAVAFVSFDSEVSTTKELTTKEIVEKMKASQEEEEEEEVFSLPRFLETLITKYGCYEIRPRSLEFRLKRSPLYHALTGMFICFK